MPPIFTLLKTQRLLKYLLHATHFCVCREPGSPRPQLHLILPTTLGWYLKNYLHRYPFPGVLYPVTWCHKSSLSSTSTNGGKSWMLNTNLCSILLYYCYRAAALRRIMYICMYIYVLLHFTVEGVPLQLCFVSEWRLVSL